MYDLATSKMRSSPCRCSHGLIQRISGEVFDVICCQINLDSTMICAQMIVPDAVLGCLAASRTPISGMSLTWIIAIAYQYERNLWICRCDEKLGCHGAPACSSPTKLWHSSRSALHLGKPKVVEQERIAG